MTNYSKLQNLTENDINIINNDIFIKNVKLGGPFIDIFFGKNSGFNNDHKKTMLSYFLTSKDLISSINYNEKTNESKVFFKKNILELVKVQHDPEKDEFFTVSYDFRSLLNLQGHTFKHCIADYWKNRGSAPDFIEENKKYFDEFWNKFRKIGCNFFSNIKLSDIDTREKAIKVFNSYEKKIMNNFIERMKNERNKKTLTYDSFDQLKDITDKFETRSCCMDCINEHNGPDTFLKCWKLFSGHNIHESYLKKIRKWIVKTIKDQKNIELYKGNTTNGTPERRHIHYRKDGDVYINSYALDYKSALDDESDKKGHVFCLIFKKYRNGYHLKTAYPLTISIKPVMEIYSHAKTKIGNKEILNCCHASNWSGIKKMLCKK